MKLFFNDPMFEQQAFGALGQSLYAALRCPKQLIRFTNAEGAGDHCEAMARARFHQRSFDWLDEVLDVATGNARPAPRG